MAMAHAWRAETPLIQGPRHSFHRRGLQFNLSESMSATEENFSRLRQTIGVEGQCVCRWHYGRRIVECRHVCRPRAVHHRIRCVRIISGTLTPLASPESSRMNSPNSDLANETNAKAPAAWRDAVQCTGPHHVDKMKMPPAELGGLLPRATLDV
jgi:hypothetical protein